MPHIHEKIDFTVEVFIVFQNTVLLRKHDKYGIWLSVGGHIELDEDPMEAALREVREEVGLTVELSRTGLLREENSENYKELIPPRFMNIHRINDNHKHVALVYLATSQSDRVVEGESEKSKGWRWFTGDELQDPAWGLRNNIKFYAEQALKELGR